MIVFGRLGAVPSGEVTHFCPNRQRQPINAILYQGAENKQIVREGGSFDSYSIDLSIGYTCK